MSKDTNQGRANDTLPDDEALGAFAAAAFGPPARNRTPAGQSGGGVSEAPAAEHVPTAEPQSSLAPQPPAVPAPSPEPAPVAEVAVPDAPPVPVAHRPQPLPRTPQPGKVTIPDYGPMGTRPVQCTVMIARTVRDRLAAYQLAKKMETGKEPTNALVVRRAFLHARKNSLFGKLVRDLQLRQGTVDEEDFDEDGILGGVSGRKAERGRVKDNVQQSFRPSTQELAAYDAFAEAYDFPTRSEFLDALLDEFLPQQASSSRRGR